MDCSLVLMVTHDPPVKVEQECDALLPGPPCPPQARSPDCVWTYLHAQEFTKMIDPVLIIHALNRAGKAVCTSVFRPQKEPPQSLDFPRWLLC